MGGISLECQNTTVRVNGAWLKDIAFYVQKHIYNTLHSCHNFPAGSRQAARAPASVKRQRASDGEL